MPRKRKHRKALWIGLRPGFYVCIQGVRLWKCLCGGLYFHASARMTMNSFLYLARTEAPVEGLCTCNPHGSAST